VNCCVRPLAIEAFAGVIVIETRAAELTVKEAVPLIVPEVAVIVGVPTAEPVAKPPAVMVAPVVELQVTELVKVWVVPSE